MLAITHRLPAPLRRTRSALPRPGWALLAGLYAAALVATYLSQVEWISDSRFYLAWSYRYLGYSELEAAHLTKDYLADLPGLAGYCDFCWPAGYEHSLFHGESGAVSGPRLMYPLLSAPFVGVFGPPGMLVVPLLSYAVAVVALAVLASRWWGPWWGAAAGAMMLLSATATRFAGFAMTDALALMFNVLLLLFLPLRRDTRRRDLVWFLCLLCLGLFTRQFAITAAVGVISAWLLVAVRERRVRNAWLPFAVGSAALTVVVLTVQGRVAAWLLAGDALSLTDRYRGLALERFGVDGLASIPVVLGHIASADYDYVRKRDMFLIVLLVLACVACVWRFRSELSALLAGMSASTLALAVVIVDPTYFRYFVPVVPLLVLSVLALLADLFAAPYRRPSRSTEATPGQGPPDIGEATAGPLWALPVAGWCLLAGAQLLMIFLVLHLYGGSSLAALSVLTLAVVALVLLASHRAGPLAGGLTGLMLIGSVTVAAQAGGALTDAVTLLAVVGTLATLPGSGWWERVPGRSLLGFGVLLGAALVLDPRAVTLAVGVVVASFVEALRQRGRRNDWTLPAVTSLGLAGLAYAADLLLPGWPTGDTQPFHDLFARLAGDRVLYAVCLLTVVALLIRWRSASTWFVLGAVGAALLLPPVGGPGQPLGALVVVYPAMVLLVAETVSGLVAVRRVDGAAAARIPRPRQPDTAAAYAGR